MAVSGYCFNAYNVIPKKKKRVETNRTESSSSTCSSTSGTTSSKSRCDTEKPAEKKHWYGSEAPKRHQWGPRT